MKNDSSGGSDLDRRDFLKYIGTGATAGIAGCGSQEDTNNPENDNNNPEKDNNTEIDPRKSENSSSNTQKEEDDTDTEIEPGIENVSITPENPELGEEVKLNASIQGEEQIDNVLWKVNNQTEIQGNNATHVFEDVDEYELELILQGDFEPLTETYNIETSLWDNSEMRKRHINYHPAAKEVNQSTYSMSIFDEEKIRQVANQETLKSRIDWFEKLDAVMNFTDYENIINWSHMPLGSIARYPKTVELEEFEDAWNQVEKQLEETDKFDNKENARVYSGDLLPPRGEEPYPEDSEGLHYVIIHPEKEVLQMTRAEAFREYNQQVFETNDTEKYINQALKTMRGDLQTLEKEAEDYIKSDQFNTKGILIDRIGHNPSIAGMSKVERGNIHGVEPLSNELGLGGQYNGFDIINLIYEPEDAGLKEVVKGPYGDKDLLEGNDIERLSNHNETYDRGSMEGNDVLDALSLHQGT